MGQVEKRLHLHAEAEAKCIECQHKWWVGADPKRTLADMPNCPKCFGFGIATGRARMVKEG